MLTIPQIAKRSGYHPNSLYRFVMSGKFPPPRKVGAHGRTYYSAADIDFFLKTHDGTGARGPIKKRRRRVQV